MKMPIVFRKNYEKLNSKDSDVNMKLKSGCCSNHGQRTRVVEIKNCRHSFCDSCVRILMNDCVCPLCKEMPIVEKVKEGNREMLKQENRFKHHIQPKFIFRP